MGMFDGMTTDESIKEEKDSLRGGSFEPLASGIYDLTIKYAYASKSAGGATALNVVLVDKDNNEIKDQQWMTSGEAKGCKNYYMVKKDGKETGEKAYLPGFNAINSLCLLTVGKGIAELATEKKTIMLYDWDSQGEKPTEVDMVTELIGKQVTAAVLYQIVDKKAKNTQTGQYEPTGQTRKQNTVDKYFRQRDKMTVAEIRAQAEEAVFVKTWEDKWKDQVDDQSSGVSAASGTTGKPVASGNDTPTESLFK